MSVLILLLLVLVQILSGIVVLGASLRAGLSRLPTVVGLGSLLGMLGFLLGDQVSVLLFGNSIGWALLPVLAIVLSVMSYPRRKVADLVRDRSTSWLALSWVPAAFVSVALQIPNWIRTPIRDGYVVGNQYHSDLVFFEAVGQSVSLLGPNESLLLADAPIKYHWFIYGWSGLVTRLSGAEAFWVTTRLMPILLIVLGAFLAAQWASMLSKVRWVPPLAAWLVVVAGYVGADQGVIVTFDSPSTGFASVLLLAFAMTVTLALRASSPVTFIVLVGFWAFALVGAKASHAAVAGIGIAVMALALTLRRDAGQRATAWALVLATAAGTIGAYLLLLAGISSSDSQIGFGGEAPNASTYQGLDPGPGLLGIILGTMILLLAMAPRWIGLVALVGSRGGRQLPETWLGIGMIVAGVVPLFALTSGTNAAWFALGASAPVAVLSTVGIGILRERVRIPRSRRMSLAVGIAGTAILAWLATVLNYGLVQISGAPVAWRSPMLAWAIVLLGSLSIMSLNRGRWIARVGLILALAISLTAILARVAGPVLWNYTAGILTPPLSQLVLTLDPEAELSGAEEPQLKDSGHPAHDLGAPRSAIALVPRQDYSQADLVANSIAFSDERVQWSPQRATAATVLGDLMSPTDVVAMDASISQPFLPIALDSPVLLAGQPYTDGYTSATAARSIPDRFAAIDDFRLTASPAAHQYLWDMGVRWLWLEFSPDGDADRLSSVTELVFADTDVAVLKLNEPGANSG